MGFLGHRKPNESMRLIVTTFVGVVFGFFIGVSFPAFSLTKLNLPPSVIPIIDVARVGEKNSVLRDEPSVAKGTSNSSIQAQNLTDPSKIWVPTNPRGAERLPPSIVASESDFYLRRLWGNPNEFSENFTILLFHYDGCTTEWEEFEWSKRAIHVSVQKQTKWYLKLVRKHGLEISQPGLDPSRGTTWQMTKRRGDHEVHKETEEKPGWCKDTHLPPCAAFVEIMAPVFSREAWRCVWHMLQGP